MNGYNIMLNIQTQYREHITLFKIMKVDRETLVCGLPFLYYILATSLC